MRLKETPSSTDGFKQASAVFWEAYGVFDFFMHTEIQTHFSY